MIRTGIYLYKQASTGDWLRVGEIIDGIDAKYIEWYL